MGAGSETAPYDLPRVAGTRSFRLVHRWWKGWGRFAGRLLPVALLMPLVVVLFVSWLATGVCPSSTAINDPYTYEYPCEANFHFLYLLGEGAALFLILLIVATLIARLELRIRRTKASRAARTHLAEIQRRIGSDPTQDTVYGPLHATWSTGAAPDAPYRTASVLERFLAIGFGITALLLMMETASSFERLGQLLPMSATEEARQHMAGLLLFIAYSTFAVKLARGERAARHAAQELRERFEMQLGAAEAELVRRHERPDEVDHGPGFTFRRYGASTGSAAAKS